MSAAVAGGRTVPRPAGFGSTGATRTSTTLPARATGLGSSTAPRTSTTTHVVGMQAATSVGRSRGATVGATRSTSGASSGASRSSSSKGPSASSSASSSAGARSRVASSAPIVASAATATKTVTTDKISSRLNPKSVDFFKGGSSGKKSQFESVYSNGGIPCRLMHGSVKHKIQWDAPPESLAYDTVLIHIAEGLRETIHPYCFLARTGYKELMEAPGAAGKVIPLLPKVVASLRTALVSDNKDVFIAALEALAQTSNTVGGELTPHLKVLLPPLSKQLMDKTNRDRVTDVLNSLEGNGGREALAVIKSKVPTYQALC
eukprot:Opistho-2@33567